MLLRTVSQTSFASIQYHADKALLDALVSFLPTFVDLLAPETRGTGSSPETPTATHLMVQMADCTLLITNEIVMASRQPSKTNNKDDASPNSAGSQEEWRRCLWQHRPLIIHLVQTLKVWKERENNGIMSLALGHIRRYLISLGSACNERAIPRSISNNTGLTEMQENHAMDKLEYMWGCWCTMLMQDCPTLTSAKDYVNEIANQFSFILIHNNFEFGMATLVRLCLVLGRLDRDNMFRLVDRLDRMDLDVRGPLLSVLKLSSTSPAHEASQLMAATIFRRLTFALLDHVTTSDDSADVEDVIDEIIPQLLDVLRHHSECCPSAITGLFTDLIMCDTSFTPLIEHLWKNSHSPDGKDKVYSAVLRNLYQTAAFVNKGYSCTKQILAKQLIENMSDETMFETYHGAALFKALDPHFIIPLIWRRPKAEGKSKSEHDLDILLTTIKSHEKPVDIVTVSLDLLRESSWVTARETQNSEKLPILQDPSQIVISSQKAKQPSAYDEGVIESTLSVLITWLTHLEDKQMWTQLLTETLQRTFAFPEDTVFIKLLAEMSSKGLFDPPERLKHVLRACITCMASQKNLSEEHLQAESGEVVKALLFQRLSPLLVLRLLPFEPFSRIDSLGESNEGVDQDLELELLPALRDNLIHRMDGQENQLEYPQVRQLAAEIFARWDVEQVLREGLVSLRKAVENKNIISAKLALYCLCHFFSIHGSKYSQFVAEQQKQQETDIVSHHGPGKSGPDSKTFSRVHSRAKIALRGMVPVLSSFLLSILAWPLGNASDSTISKEVEAEIEKLQRGCIDCLSAILVTFFEHFLDDFDQVDSKKESSPYRWSGLLSCILFYIDPKNSHPDLAFPDFPDFYFVSQVHRPASSPSLRIDPLIPGMVDPNQDTRLTVHAGFCICLANVVLSSINRLDLNQVLALMDTFLPYLCATARTHPESALRAAAVQILFTMSFRLSGAIEPYSKDLVTTTLQALQTSSPQLVLAGLKLLGALLAHVPDMVVRHSTDFGDIAQALIVLSQKGATTEIKSLASQLGEAVNLPNILRGNI